MHTNAYVHAHTAASLNPRPPPCVVFHYLIKKLLCLSLAVTPPASSAVLQQGDITPVHDPRTPAPRTHPHSLTHTSFHSLLHPSVLLFLQAFSSSFSSFFPPLPRRFTPLILRLPLSLPSSPPSPLPHGAAAAAAKSLHNRRQAVSTHGAPGVCQPGKS